MPSIGKNLTVNPLAKSNIVVTGGSRDIGGGIVLELANSGADVLSIFRSKPDRAQKIADEAKKSGKEPTLLQADLTTPEGKEAVFKAWKEKFNNQIDVLVLCASGATIEINVDANMALVDKFISLRQEKLKNGEKLSVASIIFLQSEPGHYQRVIDGVFDFIDYYRDKVGPAKRAGEDAFKQRLSKMEEVGIRGIVVCPPEVTDTFNMKLFELQNKEARVKSRELSLMLGTESFVTIAAVAQRVKELLEDANTPNGHLELFGNLSDGLTLLSKIYGDEAIYIHTFKKTGEGSGVGRMIVNPALWKRTEEPSYSGEIKSQDKNEIITELKITKDHMKGHFRPDIAPLFPGHKSVRTAAVSLARFLTGDIQNIKLKKYTSVKFRNTVLPGQTLTSKAKLTQKTASEVTGDVIQTVNEKETMDIRGLVVEQLKTGDESALLLDQMIEAAAQTVGMYVLEVLKNEDVLPLFHSTGEAELFMDVKPGDNLLIKAEKVKLVKAGSMNIFSADLEITRGIIEIVTENGQSVATIVKEEKVAAIKSVQGLLLPKEEALKKIT